MKPVTDRPHTTRRPWRVLVAGALCASLGFAAAPIVGADGAAAAATCGAPGSGYGRMFPTAPAATWDDSAMTALSTVMMAPAETNPTPEGRPDPEDNLDIAAGYTYFGQFVDHDLTLDDRPNDLTTPTPVSALVNLRTPQLDLDSVYGKGPTLSSQLYESDGMRLKVGTALSGGTDKGSVDLPRGTNGQAVIGDPRNDENRMVAAIHALFLRFHNQTVQRVRAENPKLTSSQVFEQARRQVVARYQWIILTDFLPQIVGRETTDAVVRRTPTGWATNLRLYNACQQMPVEFSVAAYRFGHSMVRGLYRLNNTTDRLPVFSGTYVAGSDLAGFSPAPSNFGTSWELFVPGVNGADPRAVQWSYKTDGSLTHSLSLLPLPTTGTGPANLAKRNLMRSTQLGLPSGQTVARAMGVTPLRDDQILVGAATGDPADTRAITDVSSAFAGNAPLWAYVLAESTATAYPVRGGRIVGPKRAPMRLGPVGGRIVAETIVGLMASDANSVIATKASPPDGRYGLRTLVENVLNPPAPRTPPPPPAPRAPAPPKPRR